MDRPPRIAVVGHVEHITLGRVDRLPGEGDIVALDGEKVAGASDVGAAVQGAKPGTTVYIKYTRSRKSEPATAELGSTPGD